MAIFNLKNGHFQFEKWPFFLRLQTFSENMQAFSLHEIRINCFALGLSALAHGRNSSLLNLNYCCPEKICKPHKSLYTWDPPNVLYIRAYFLAIKQPDFAIIRPRRKRHPLYLRGGARKPLDMSQVGVTDLALPRGSGPKGRGSMILTFPRHQWLLIMLYSQCI